MRQRIAVTLFATSLALLAHAPAARAQRSEPLIIDHRHTDLSQVPDAWVAEARRVLRLSYGHTSHGSQLITGMAYLRASISATTFAFNTDGALQVSVLSLDDTTPPGDLGNPDRTTWATLTRQYLNGPSGTGPSRTVVLWSWCGQASSATATDINTYLSLMSQLETEFPHVTFVYMTGHLDGSGPSGNLALRNAQIRAYAQQHNKVLFDFADIESYDPAGTFYPNGSDACEWCTSWCSSHTSDCSDLTSLMGDCAHSHRFNCRQKGRAFWWMAARLAGWDGTPGSLQGGLITGTVRAGATQAPVPNADVLFYANTGASAGTVTTNAQGQYTSPSLPAGTYFVKAVPPAATMLIGQLHAGRLCPLGSCSVTSGTPVGVTSGAVTPNVNFGLPAGGSVGLVDTPFQGETGVVGTVAVTGWAVDDAGLAGVQIYRNCLPFEPAVHCAAVEGRNVVYVGNATLVDGARPDVEAIYPTYPGAGRAGWGYALLTNLLPHVPRAEMFGGQGAMALAALAIGGRGQRTWLGRTIADTTPTSLTLANDTLAKPFGAIDTPSQGETRSGIFPNFGWALTPDSNTIADAGDIVVPATGSSITVWVDGAPLGSLAAFNLCRGTTPTPAFCDDDIASVFGHPSPQAPYTPRTSNPTVFRNLDAGRGAIGYRFIDTTTLSDGLHTIAWSVYDSAGRGEGIGSRHFGVANDGRPAWGGLFNPQPDAPAAGAALTISPVRQVADTRGSGEVRGRTGFNVEAPLLSMTPDHDGVRHATLSSFDRLELGLGAVDDGWLETHGARRPLPVGSRLDTAAGTFTWAPGVGFLGRYRLVFTRGSTETAVDIDVRHRRERRPDEAEIGMHLDAPHPGQVVGGRFIVAGWAIDPDAGIGSGIDLVHVWAHRRDLAGEAPRFLGAATLGGRRPDVAGVHGAQFHDAGFSLAADALPPGRYDITAYVWNRRTARWEDARSVGIVVR